MTVTKSSGTGTRPGGGSGAAAAADADQPVHDLVCRGAGPTSTTGRFRLTPSPRTRMRPGAERLDERAGHRRGLQLSADSCSGAANCRLRPQAGRHDPGTAAAQHAPRSSPALNGKSIPNRTLAPEQRAGRFRRRDVRCPAVLGRCRVQLQMLASFGGKSTSSVEGQDGLQLVVVSCGQTGQESGCVFKRDNCS